MPLSLLANLIQGSEQTRFAKQRYSRNNWQYFTSYERPRVVNGVQTGTKPIAFVWTTPRVNSRQRQIIQEVFDRIDSRIGLDFILQPASSRAPDIAYGMLIDYFSDPTDFAGSPAYAYYDTGDIAINKDRIVGDKAFNDVIQHEIGHALGLAHPWEKSVNGITYPQDRYSDEQTVMAYRSTDPAQETWRAADIEALVDIWGAEQASGGIPPAFEGGNGTGSWFAEFGRALVDTNWLKITLTRSYRSPVVIVSDPGFSHADPVAVRLRNVGPTSFELKLQEPAHLDRVHGLESLSYIVVEAGDWTLADGTRISAGLRNTSRLSSKGFDRVKLPSGFSDVPMVMAQVQSVNDPAWVSNRVGGLSRTGFQLALQEEEALNRGTHGSESVGWLAIDPGTANDGNDRFEAIHTPRTTTNAPATIQYQTAFGQTPTLLTRIGSNGDLDPALSRVNAVLPESFQVRIQEDQSLDAETTHGQEAISYLALEREFGTLEGSAYVPPPVTTVGEYGSVNLNSNWRTITLGRTYVNPVVIVSDPTLNAADPVAVRLRNVAGTSFEIRLQEPNYSDGVHGLEKVSWLVMEAGNWQLSDGSRLSAGTKSSGRLSSGGFDSVGFGTPFTDTPSVLTQVQTFNERDWVTTRTRGQNSGGFQLAMQEEEKRNGGTHAVEKIGWLAFDNGVANDGDTLIQGGTTARTVGSTPARLTYHQPFGGTPSLLAKLSSSTGLEPANLRLHGIGASSWGARVYEDKSFDSETFHGPETVSWLALAGGAGTLQARAI